MKFHASSLGLLMTDAQSIDRALVPVELLPVLDKARKTDDDRKLLQPFKEASLSAGAKTYLNRLAKEQVYGYKLQVETKYMDKGLACEPAAIKMLNDLRFNSYSKNIERRESEFLTGECDIYVPGVKTIDTKVAWSLDTFPAVSEDAHDPLYEWQGHVYMKLWAVPEHEVCWLMLDTPEEMIRWEQVALHHVGHIEPELRCTSITYKRDAALEAKMDAKCAAAMRYLLRRIDQIHAERVPKKIIMMGEYLPKELTSINEAANELGKAILTAKAKEYAEMTNFKAEQEKLRALSESRMDALVTHDAELNIAEFGKAMAQSMFTRTGTVHMIDGKAEYVVDTHKSTEPPTLRLGKIGERLGFTVAADFLLQLGFAPAATVKASKLYHESDFPKICATLQRHIAAVQAVYQ